MGLAAACTLAFCGCRKQAKVNAPRLTSSTTQPAPEITAEPPYVIPDKLPVRATLSLVRTDDGAAVYKATFDQKFAFDPEKANLALNVNTTGWRYHGRIVITDKDDNERPGSRRTRSFTSSRRRPSSSICRKNTCLPPHGEPVDQAGRRYAADPQ